MTRFSRLLLPMAILLLASCSETSQPQKSDLQMASSAAMVAGADEEASRHSPMILVPKQTEAEKASAPANKPKLIVAGLQPVSVIPTAPVSQVQEKMPDQPAIPAPIVAAASQPLTAGPVAASPVEVMPTDIETTKPATGTAIHLASYREIGSAKRGWQILSRSYKELVPLKPLYVAVDLPGKGHILRLYGTGGDASSLKNICSEMQADGAYCAANIAF